MWLQAAFKQLPSNKITQEQQTKFLQSVQQ